MSTAPPILAIGLPIYNGQDYLAQSIESLLAQTFTDFELVIADNASTDSSQEICRAIAARDSRVKYHRFEENIGANPNFTRVFQLAPKTEYFKWAASDDIHLPDYISSSLALLQSDPSIAVAYPKTKLVDELARPLGEDPNLPVLTDSDSPSRRFRGSLKEVWCFAIFGVMRRRQLLETPLMRPFYGSDKVLLAELALKGKISRVERELFLRRCHTQQSSSMGTAERAVWAASSGKSRVPFQLTMYQNYFSVVSNDKSLSFSERAKCLAALAAMPLTGDKLKKYFLPGPYNYFGFDPARERREAEARAAELKSRQTDPTP